MQEQTNTGMETKFEPQRQSVGRNPQDKARQGKVRTEEINPDFEELCFESIQVESSNFKPVGDETFAKTQA